MSDSYDSYSLGGFKVNVPVQTFTKPTEFYLRGYSDIKFEYGSVPFDLVLSKYRLISNIYEIQSTQDIGNSLEVEFTHSYYNESQWNYNTYNKVLRTKPYKIPKKNTMYESVLSIEDWIEIDEFDYDVTTTRQTFTFDVYDINYYYCLAWEFEY